MKHVEIPILESEDSVLVDWNKISGVALSFATMLLGTWLADKDIKHIAAALKRSNIDDKLVVQLGLVAAAVNVMKMLQIWSWLNADHSLYACLNLEQPLHFYAMTFPNSFTISSKL